MIRLQLLLILLLALPACSVLERFAGEETPEGSGGQVAGALATAQAVAQSAATAAAIAQEEGGAALATAQALATAELPLDLGVLAFEIEELAQLFETIELGEDGQATITITDDQVNQVFATWESADPAARLRNVDVAFGADGNIVLAGDVILPLISNRLTVGFQPAIMDGVLRFQVVSASYGEQEVPAALLATASGMLEQTLGEAVTYLPQNVQLRQVSVTDGQMILIAGRA